MAREEERFDLVQMDLAWLAATLGSNSRMFADCLAPITEAAGLG